MNRFLERTIVLALAAASPMVSACDPSPPLDGTTVIIESCDVRIETCLHADEALAQYAGVPDNDLTLLSVAMQASPWRLYDPELRIVSPQELADRLGPHLKPEVKVVRLDANWTATSPGEGRASLAAQVSSALKGFPVTGRDGFVWFKRDGSIRVTRQSFTGRRSGNYLIKPGEDVMSALVPGWAVQFEDKIAEDKSAEGVLLAAVGWDVFMLCPDKALQAFERADSLGSAIAAYNAAVMRLDRAQAGDRAAAIALLGRAAKRGDAKAAALLTTLQK